MRYDSFTRRFSIIVFLVCNVLDSGSLDGTIVNNATSTVTHNDTRRENIYESNKTIVQNETIISSTSESPVPTTMTIPETTLIVDVTEINDFRNNSNPEIGVRTTMVEGTTVKNNKSEIKTNTSNENGVLSQDGKKNKTNEDIFKNNTITNETISATIHNSYNKNITNITNNNNNGSTYDVMKNKTITDETASGTIHKHSHTKNVTNITKNNNNGSTYDIINESSSENKNDTNFVDTKIQKESVVDLKSAQQKSFNKTDAPTRVVGIEKRPTSNSINTTESVSILNVNNKNIYVLLNPIDLNKENVFNVMCKQRDENGAICDYLKNVNLNGNKNIVFRLKSNVPDVCIIYKECLGLSNNKENQILTEKPIYPFLLKKIHEKEKYLLLNSYVFNRFAGDCSTLIETMYMGFLYHSESKLSQFTLSKDKDDVNNNNNNNKTDRKIIVRLVSKQRDKNLYSIKISPTGIDSRILYYYNDTQFFMKINNSLIKIPTIAYPDTIEREHNEGIYDTVLSHIKSNSYFYIYLLLGFLQTTVVVKYCRLLKKGKYEKTCKFPNFFEEKTKRFDKRSETNKPLISSKSTIQLYPLKSTNVPTIVKQ